MTTVSVYLTFNGNCEEAFTFYNTVFGGNYLEFKRYKDMPSAGEAPSSSSDDAKIMHVSLPIGGDFCLMGSDASSKFGPGTVQVGNNFSLSLSPKTNAEADLVFGKLALGGKVNMSMDNTFWGAYFGMLTDKFGINWMLCVEAGKK